jgi:hypothetical protein
MPPMLRPSPSPPPPPPRNLKAAAPRKSRGATVAVNPSKSRPWNEIPAPAMVSGAGFRGREGQWGKPRSN